MRSNNIQFDRKFLSELSYRLGAKASWLNGLKSVRSAMGYFNRVPLILIGKLRQTDSLAVFAFVKLILKLRRKQGSKGLALWLKSNQVTLMSYLAGQRPHSRTVGTAVSVTRSGIPRVIPREHRKVIRDRRQGWEKLAKLWMSLFGFYRVLDFKGKINISTITDPGVEFDMDMFSMYISIFRDLVISKELKYKWKPLLILKSAPGVRNKEFANSTAAAARQASAILGNLAVYKPLWALYKLYGASWVIPKLEAAAKMWDRWYDPVRFPLGKLGCKDEPGKVRVFAMVDWWTQTLLKPIHDWIIDNLSKLPMDSTLDQDAGVKRASFLVRLSHFGGSYDLSAATDRLPASLQEKLMDSLIPGSGSLWRDCLTRRAYALGKRKLIYYSVGQPMGAYSSWAMLAYTHHFIVQVAAWQMGVAVDKEGKYSLYTGYQILGDDIVIFNDKVATQYLKIMSLLGVKISFAKSVVSKDTIEFAKRFVSKGHDLSPLAFKELDVAMASLDALAHLLKKFRGELPVSLLARLRGAGYRTRSTLFSRLGRLSSHMRNLVIWSKMPGISNWSWDTYSEWIGMKSFNSTDPDSINYEQLQVRISESVKALGKDEWLPSGGHIIHEQGKVIFRHFPGLNECSASYITPLQDQITDDLRELSRDWEWLIHTHDFSNSDEFEKVMRELLVMERKVAAARTGVVMNSRKEFNTPLFSGKWLRLWHRLHK